MKNVFLFVLLALLMMVAMFLFWTLNCVYGWVKWTKSTNKSYERING